MRIITASDLGAFVRQARQDQGLTQSDLAGRAGATRQWVAQLESGAPNIRLELVLATLRALDLRIDVGSGPRPAQSLPAPEPGSGLCLDGVDAPDPAVSSRAPSPRLAAVLREQQQRLAQILDESGGLTIDDEAGR